MVELAWSMGTESIVRFAKSAELTGWAASWCPLRISTSPDRSAPCAPGCIAEGPLSSPEAFFALR